MYREITSDKTILVGKATFGLNGGRRAKHKPENAIIFHSSEQAMEPH